MRKITIFALAAFAFSSAFANAVVSDYTNPRDRKFSPEEIQKTKDAAPKKLLRKPAKTRNILVFSKTEGYRHCDGIPAFKELLKAMGENFKGSWKLTFTEDPAMFEPETLKKFDCVILNNPTGRFFSEEKKAREQMSEDERKANEDLNKRCLENLLQYVENGGGIMGMHAACDAQGGSKYVEMMGGLFAGHPWGAGNAPVTVLVEDPNNILLRGLWKDKEFQIRDEIYTFQDKSFSRDAQRVLMSLDLERSPVDGGVDPMTRTGRKSKDFGLAWVKTYGKGRIFYGAFGHRHDVYFLNPELCEFYCRGIQYATGDIKPEVKPLGELKAKK